MAQGSSKTQLNLPIAASSQLEQLAAVLAQVAAGNFSPNLPRATDSQELAAVYSNLERMLETVRTKMAGAEALQTELSQRVAARTQELERSQSQLVSMVSYTPNFIHIVDTDLRVLFINRGGSLLKPDDLVGTMVGERMDPADRRRVRRRLRQVIKSGKPIQYEFLGMGSKSKMVYYRTSAGPIKRDGVVTGLVLITSDISEIRHHTNALRKGKQQAESAQARDHALLNSIGEGLVVINEHGKIGTINPSGAAMLGYEVEELTGGWFPRVVPALDEAGKEIDTLDRPVMRALSGGRMVREQVYYRRKDGSNFPVAVTISPVIIKGKPVGAIEVFRDLTQERELDQAKEEFVSLASHQLRTPATGVKAYISMLLDGYAGQLSPQQQEYLRKVFQANERQLQIVNDMLNVAQTDAGRLKPEMVTVEVNRLIHDIVEEQRPTIVERQQGLEVAMPEAPVTATLDPKLIRMAVENILGNASKYTPAGGTIQVRLTLAGQGMRLAISDTGVGIASEDLPKLFKRFSRINNPLSTVRGGNGLGLYLANTITRLHTGRLKVDSAVGVGTTFTMELPLQPPATPTVTVRRRTRRSSPKPGVTS
jgi:PAS domain S-box-containing protein